MSEITLVTGNPNKLCELQAIFPASAKVLPRPLVQLLLTNPQGALLLARRQRSA